MRLGPSIPSGTEPLFLSVEICCDHIAFGVLFRLDSCALLHFIVVCRRSISRAYIRTDGERVSADGERQIEPAVYEAEYPAVVGTAVSGARIILERSRQTVYVAVGYLRTRFGRDTHPQPMQLCLRGVALARLGAAVAYRDIRLYVIYRCFVGHVDAGDEQRQRTGCAVTA